MSTILRQIKLGKKKAASLAADIKAASHYAGHLLDSAQTLLDTTNAYLELSRRLEKAYVYAHKRKMTKTHEWLNTKSTNQKGMSLYASELGETCLLWSEFIHMDEQQGL